MNYSTYLALVLATAGRNPTENAAMATPDLSDVLQLTLNGVYVLVERLRQGPLSPLATAQFEKDLQHVTRELGRVVAQWTYNHLEPADKQALPVQVHAEGSRFRRLTDKTPQQVSTQFGTITLRRMGYRAALADGEPVLFPLWQALDLVHNATLALVERVTHYQA